MQMDTATLVLLKDASTAQQILEFPMVFVFHVPTLSTTANLAATEINVRDAMSMLQVFLMEDALAVITDGPHKVGLKSASVWMMGLFKSL
jgi:hypothetical protein